MIIPAQYVSKAAQKRDLEELNRQFEKKRDKFFDEHVYGNAEYEVFMYEMTNLNNAGSAKCRKIFSDNMMKAGVTEFYSDVMVMLNNRDIIKNTSIMTKEQVAAQKKKESEEAAPKAVRNMMEQLNEVMSSPDAKILEEHIAKVTDIYNRYHEFEVFEGISLLKAGKRQEFNQRVLRITGNEENYVLVSQNKLNTVLKFVERQHASKIAARNAKIANLLIKIGIEEVLCGDYVSTIDGFVGDFFVDTPNGRKTVNIRIIVAGGYNIQRIHNRILVKVK